MKPSIFSKLLIGPVVAIILASMAMAFALVEINSIVNQTQSIYDHPLRVTRAALEANVDVARMHKNMKELVLSADVTELEEEIIQVNRLEKEVYEHLAVVEEWILAEQGAKLHDETLRLFKDWKPIREEVIASLRNGNQVEAKKISKGKSENHVQLLNDKIMQVKTYAATKSDEMVTNVKEIHKDTIVYMLMFFIVSLLIIGIAGYVVAKNISDPIKTLNATAQQVKSGNLNQRATGINDREIGELAQTFNEMVEKLATWNHQLESEVRNKTEELYRFNANLEKQVQKRTAELQAANKELEAFSYSVSHDLKAPLRALQGFSNNVHEKYGDQLDDTGKRWLMFIKTNAERMDTLISHILSFSRLSRAEVKKESVDMNELANQMIAQEKLVCKQPVSVKVKQLPTAWGDATLLSVVWQNLIGNAFKYSSTKEKVEIEISGFEDEQFCHYSITDHGVGFDMQHADKLFVIFQRLHAADEFEGTGIGLANVSRIVQKHGGEISATAAVGAGATFNFSLTKKV